MTPRLRLTGAGSLAHDGHNRSRRIPPCPHRVNESYTQATRPTPQHGGTKRVDPETIGATAGLITAAVGLVTAIGAGIWKLISRADRIREHREAQLIATLKAQVAAKDREIIRLHRVIDILRADATAWREQLIRNDIEPEPNHWTVHPEEEL